MKQLLHGFLANRKEGFFQIILIIGSLFLLNWLIGTFVARFDLTQDKRYTLSQASKDIAENVVNPITVTAYFSGDLPPQLKMVQDQFRDFLDEFRAYSGGNVEYRFINPNQDETAEQKAQQNGIQPVLLDVRERDQVSQKRAYLGAVLQYGDKKEVIPLIQPGPGLEFTIASTIKRLTAVVKPKIGLLTQFETPKKEVIPQALELLRQQYEVVDVAGIDTSAVPADIEALLIIGPKESLPGEALLAIDQYLMSGGTIVFALNRVDADLQMGTAKLLDTGLETLLAAYGTPLNGDLLRDINSASINVRQQRGVFSIMNQVKYPYIPQITTFGDHPISSGIESVMFQFVSTLDLTSADTSISVVPLAFSSEQAGTARGMFDLNPMQDWKQNQFTERRLPVAALVSGSFPSAFALADTVEVTRDKSVNTSFIVIGDADFLINGEGQAQQLMPEDNMNLLLNSVDFLADDTGLLELRTKGITSRPLDMVEDSTKSLIKYANVFSPILLVILYGVFRWRRKKALRFKWQQEGI